MSDYASLLAARPEVLREEAESWRRTVDALAHRTWDVRDVSTTLATVWPAGAGEQASRYVGGLADRVDGSANRMRAVPQILDDAAARLSDLQRRLGAVTATIRASHAVVHPDGSVDRTPSTARDRGPTPDELARGDAAIDELAAVVREARQLDADVTAALQDAAPPPGEVEYARARMVPPPVVPQGLSPARTREWWASLSDPQREALTRQDPRLVGNLDGIPAVDRDRANRLILPVARAQLARQRHDLERGGVTRRERDDLDRLNQRQSALDAIDARLHRPPPGRPSAMLLGFDPWVDDVGRAVVAVGNPDTATNVATLVPGVGTDLDDHFQGDIRRVDNLWNEASTDRLRPDESNATITWLGYAPPSDLAGGALSGSESEAGGQSLARFQDGLRATHNGPASHNTVIGHSYGSTTVGEAAQTPGGLHADDVVLVGSPGMHQATAADFGLPPGHVFATRSDGDATINSAEIAVSALSGAGENGGVPVGVPGASPSLVQGFDPTLPPFGATVLPSNPVTSHSDYFERGTVSLERVGDVVSRPRMNR